jgi:predicted O-linked N-acetylglucosamine transferase (SPINDLY family)
LPARANGYITFGCLNNFCKVNDRVLELWATIIRQTPGSRLILLVPPGPARQQMEAKLKEEGIEQLRLEWADRIPRMDYLRIYNRIDLGLDTFPYNGHTTSLDSIWMGVPVVTLVGQTVVGRAGWSQLCNLDLKELAATTPGQFVAIARELAGDLPRLEQLRQGLRQRMLNSPLCDAKKFTRGIESAYREMWRKWCNAPEAAR